MEIGGGKINHRAKYNSFLLFNNVNVVERAQREKRRRRQESSERDEDEMEFIAHSARYENFKREKRDFTIIY